MAFYFFELPKLPVDISRNNMLLLWLSLFKAETEEVLEKIKAMEVPVMNQAINAYYTITASSEFREKERLRAKARHDEAQALHRQAQESARKFAQKLLARNRPIDEIMEDTGLTREEVESLYTTAR
jgi:predicted transposase/invertase (TIGR01784 family)